MDQASQNMVEMFSGSCLLLICIWFSVQGLVRWWQKIRRANRSTAIGQRIIDIGLPTTSIAVAVVMFAGNRPEISTMVFMVLTSILAQSHYTSQWRR